MISLQRRRFLFTCIRIVLLTLVAVALERGDYLVRLEHAIYDLRVIHCQRFAPRPTDKLVQLDIDENALTQMGHFPWSRDMFAEILDEVRLAEPKVLAMDILFSDAVAPTYDQQGRMIDQDAVLANAIQKFGRVLIPCSLHFEPLSTPNPVEQTILTWLTHNPEMTVDQVISAISATGQVHAVSADEVRRAFLSLRAKAMYERIYSELAAGVNDRAALRQKMLPHADPLLTGTVLGRLFDEQYDRVLRERALLRFTLPIPKGIPPVVYAGGEEITPLLAFSSGAAYSGFVDYLPDRAEGAVRSVPLVANYRNRLVPHMALAAACAVLDADVKKIRLADNTITIPCPDGTNKVIPVSVRKKTDEGDVGFLMEIPMFGKRNDWLTMYDYPRHQVAAQHVSIFEVWLACEASHRMVTNENAADAVLLESLKLVNFDDAAQYRAAPLHGQAKREKILDTLSKMNEIKMGLASIPPADLDPGSKELLQNLTKYGRQLSEVLKQNDAFQLQLDRTRADLRAKLKGRAIFMGGTATGLLDARPTSLIFSCPGVVIHGAIFNAIMTGKMWRVAPGYVAWLITLAAGLLTGLLISNFSPLRAFFASAILILSYLAFNGYVLFDYGNLIVSAAGPLVAVALVWSGVTLTDFILEISERNRITKRFSSYVDPALVNWVLEHPEQTRFDGEIREMTMAFSDLESFTTLTEKLGEKAVQLLSEYMGEMVPVVRANQGYVAKQIGDGLFFFFGAPLPDPDHAKHAVKTILQMQEALAKFNLTLPKRGLPRLIMRLGVSTGKVVIGDAGPSDASDYTALGDSVNLASRMEAANKVFGTYNMITERTVALLDGAFLVRPIAKLRVKGKTEGVPVFEPLCAIESVTPEKQELADLTVRLVDSFERGEFATCIEVADQMDAKFGHTKFVSLYRNLSQTYLVTPPEHFDGQVVLTEK